MEFIYQLSNNPQFSTFFNKLVSFLFLLNDPKITDIMLFYTGIFCFILTIYFLKQIFWNKLILYPLFLTIPLCMSFISFGIPLYFHNLEKNESIVSKTPLGQPSSILKLNHYTIYSYNNILYQVKQECNIKDENNINLIVSSARFQYLDSIDKNCLFTMTDKNIKENND